MRLRVEPIEAAGGTLLAALVLIETETAAFSSPSYAPRVAPPRREGSAPDPFASIFAADPRVQASISLARRVAASELPVMLLAETGSGKELFAQAIHRASKRAAGPFVAINCGSISPHLLEGELFGHAPNAFTGASPKGRAGLLHAASGGTLFLDEVAEMSPAMQAALLRVLEAGEYHRLGDVRVARADVRVLCATCRDLPGLVASGAFRSDLYFRLRGAAVQLPALRQRADLLDLARHLLERLAARASLAVPLLSPEVERCLQGHSWPGNVRELRAALELALVLSQGEPVLLREHLPPELQQDLSPYEPAPSPARANETTPAQGISARHTQLERAEAEAVREALVRAKHNVSAAAKSLGVARSTLYRMMRRHHIEEEP